MAIQVGDRVLDSVGDEGTVLAIAGREAAVLFESPYDMTVMQLAELTPIPPEPAEPEALLTPAQLAQVFEMLADEYDKQGGKASSLRARADELRRKP